MLKLCSRSVLEKGKERRVDVLETHPLAISDVILLSCACILMYQMYPMQWQSMMLFLPERVHTGLPLALGIAAHPSSFTSQSGSERAQIRGSLSDFTVPFGGFHI